MIALAIMLVFILTPTAGARAATVINGRINLGTAEPFVVLAGSEITNTGPSVIDGDVGLHPGTAVGLTTANLVAGHGNEINATDAIALGAKNDLRTAMTTAGSLTPTISGLDDLSGKSLGPGVYSGGELSLPVSGVLTLRGDANSIWVFQAASTLITGSNSSVVMSGVGASACNVFWLVNSSATFGTGTDMVGTVMAEATITANTGTEVIGRLLASNAAVNLDSTTITVPSSCAAVGSVTSNGEPAITPGTPGAATVGLPYTYTFTATGDTPIFYDVTDGALPDGLTLNRTSGVLSGTPLDVDDDGFTVTASNASARTASVIARIVTSAAAGPGVSPAALLPPTGSGDGSPILPLIAVTGGVGIVLIVALRRRALRLR